MITYMGSGSCSLGRRLRTEKGCRDVRIVATAFVVVLCTFGQKCRAGTIEIYPASSDSQEEFESVANSLEPGDELILHGGVYSQNSRRAVTAKGTAEKPIVIRAAERAKPVLTRPADNIDRHNNIEFIDCCHLIVRGIAFKGGSSGVRFIRGHHVTFENCEIYETGNNALTMNSGNCDAFIIRKNHIHHTGLSQRSSTEGEGMYIGCHSGSCITTNTLVDGNYIHHLRGTSNGGNDGIEIKVGSYNNIVRNNIIHETIIGKQYPGIFVYGGGPKVNIVEGNLIWNAGEGIQVVADAIVRNNIILNCTVNGITAAPHGAVSEMRNVRIVNNTIVNHPRGVRIRWSKGRDMIFSNNAVYCPDGIAVDVLGGSQATLTANYVAGRVSGAKIDGLGFLDGGSLYGAFVNPGKRDFRPKSSSPLIGKADGRYAPKSDFDGETRQHPFDVGAHESDNRSSGPRKKLSTP